MAVESGYYIENLRISGWACKTNLPSNCSMRGLAAPQAMFIMDSIVRDVTSRVGLPLHEVSLYVRDKPL